MNTIFGNFIEKTLPNLRDALIKLVVGTNETTMNLEDFKTLMAPEPNYKVYTALVSQSGGDDVRYISSDDPQPFIIGTTYVITFNDNTGDFTNVGAPNNNVGTFFVATGTTPTNWGTAGDVELSYNNGAPIVTVLENTIGDIWFTYAGVGNYDVNSSSLFTNNKTTLFIGPLSPGFTEGYSATLGISLANVNIRTIAAPATYSDDLLSITPIEIRVYN